MEAYPRGGMQEKLYLNAECFVFSIILKVNFSGNLPFYYLNFGNRAESVTKEIC